MANKKPEKKKRNEHIYATTKGEVTEIVVTANSLTGEITFGTGVTNVYSEVTYDRPKGPKVLSRIPQAHPDVSFDTPPALLKNFDFLCAVDTNNREIQGKRVCVVGIYTFKRVLIPAAAGVKEDWQGDVPFCLEYINIRLDLKPENFGWLATYEHLLKFDIIDKTKRVGMVVDSDLGNLNAYNKRELPVDGPDFLPPNVTLIYASADAGKESLVNQALSIADSVSTQVLDALQSGKAPFNAKPRFDYRNFDNLRIIRPTRVCRHSLEGEEGCDEVDGGGEAGIGFVVACSDAAEGLEIAEEVFDEMTPLVDFEVARDAAGAIGLGRDDGHSAPFIQFGTDPVDVEGLVGEKGVEFDAGDQRRDADAVVALAGQEDEAGQVAEGVDQGDDLGRQAAARAAYGLILSPPFAPVPCWWTRTMVPSMIAYSKSGSSDNFWKIRSNTPLSAQRRKRFHTEPHRPNVAGRSRHGEPVRTSHNTASRNCRLSRPERPGSPSFPGRSGATRSHCPSLNSVRSKVGLLSPALNQIFPLKGIPFMNVYGP